MGRVIDVREGLAAFVADPERYYNETSVCERRAIAADAAQRLTDLEAENERQRAELDDLRAFVAVLDGARAAIDRHRPVIGSEHYAA